MRLLLDEHLAPSLAAQLRSRGHDVIAVADDPTLRGQPDVVVLDRATADRRALVTYDVRDFVRLVFARVAVDEPTPGLVVISSQRYDQGEIGRLPRHISQLLEDHRERDALKGRVIWLGSSDKGSAP